MGEREDNREISEAEAMRHPRRNEVYRDVGSQQHAPDDPDFIEVRHEAFDADSALLLCSDGLSDQVTSATILETVLANAGHPGGAVHDLSTPRIAPAAKNVQRAGGGGRKLRCRARHSAGQRAARRQLVYEKAGHFAYGLLCAASIAAALRYYGILDRPPVIPPPVTISVGSGTGAFASIADALAKARAGDTIEVSSGEYAAPLKLKSGVTLRGARPTCPYCV